MEKYAWKATIIEGRIEEYKFRHDNLWEEMKSVLKDAGICNYTIWNVGNELFGYYECEFGVEYAVKIQGQSDVVKRWNEYMQDILVIEIDTETGTTPSLRQVFSFR